MNNSRKLKINLGDMGILIALVVLFILFSVVTNTFCRINNLINVARQVSIVGVCSLGMTCIMLTGGIDLSIGSMIAVISVTCAKMMSAGIPVIVAVLAGLLIGVAVGAFNATSVTVFEIPPMIATLATMIALRGAAYVITGGMPVYGIPESFKFLGQGSIGPIPVPTIIMAIVFVFGYIMLNKTVFGRKIYGIGGNMETARLSGVNVKKELYKVYIMAGVLGTVAAFILMSRVNSGQPSAGDGYEMDIITAVVLGGVSVSGGEGKIGKVIIGVIFMGILANGMMLCNINDYWQKVVKGIVLVIAVAVDIRSRKMKAAVKSVKAA